MANQYRLTRNNISGKYRYERKKWDFRNEAYWEPDDTVCPQTEAAALSKLNALNRVEKWEVIA